MMSDEDNNHKDDDIWEKVKNSVSPLPSKYSQKHDDFEFEIKQQQASLKPIKQSNKTAYQAQSLNVEPVDNKPKVQATLKVNKSDNIDKSTAQKLKKGLIPISYTLDLHGKNQHQACELLISAVHMLHQSQGRCLLVITGKGDPKKGTGILNQKLQEWVNMSSIRPYILMYSHATLQDGGKGAFYLLLKRSR